MHNKNEKTKPKVSSIKRKQKKQNQKVVLENEKGKSKPEVSFAFNCIQLFYKKMKLFGTLNSLNSIKRKGDKIEREKRRYN